MSVPEKHSDGRRTAVQARLVPKRLGQRGCAYCDGHGEVFSLPAYKWVTCHVCGGTGLMP